MPRSLIESSRYSVQRKALSDEYPRFFDIEAGIQFAIGQHPEYYELVSHTTMRLLFTDRTLTSEDDGLIITPGFRVAFRIVDSQTVELLAIGIYDDVA